MHGFEAILVVLLAAVALTGFARRTGVPYPALVAIGGGGLALLPMDMPLSIDPQLALALFVAPVLLDAAYDTSLRDLKANWRPVTGLVLVAVGLTTAAVAVIAHAVIPGMPWAAAVALGAIVSPPDAVAATSILRAVRPPHRLMVVLEGESLLNDASSLLIYRVAVSAAMAGDAVLKPGSLIPLVLVTLAGSIVAGLALAWGWTRVVRAVSDVPSSIILQFVGAFGVWIIGERLSLSPILTVVVFAMSIAQTSTGTMPARLRVPSYAVWDTVVVVLNVLAFAVIGLQLGAIVSHTDWPTLADWLGFAALVLLTVIAARFVWVLGYGGLHRVRGLTLSAERRRAQRQVTWRGGLIVGWCGMRGIVTVATALALPGDFPMRGLLLFTAFAVTLGTLVIQGLTLKPLVAALSFDDDDPVDGEVRHARVELVDAALAALDGEEGQAAALMRDDLAIERRVACEAADGDGRPTLPSKRLAATLLAVRRERLIALRSDGTIGDDAFHRLEEELDLAELAVAQRL